MRKIDHDVPVVNVLKLPPSSWITFIAKPRAVLGALMHMISDLSRSRYMARVKLNLGVHNIFIHARIISQRRDADRIVESIMEPRPAQQG